MSGTRRTRAARPPDFTRPVTRAKAKVAAAELAFMARFDAIDAILDGATAHDTMMLCADALAGAMPICCDKHQDEAKADFLRLLNDCMRRRADEEAAEDDSAEAEGDGDPHPHVH
jgi:hypothetical protein